MRLTRYFYRVENGQVNSNVGCLVEVQLLNIPTDVIYQWPDNKHEAAVIHYRTGGLLAPIRNWHWGYPAERAQQAINERFQNFELDKLRERLEYIEKNYPKINPKPYRLIRWTT